jgi:hypothetical protein
VTARPNTRRQVAAFIVALLFHLASMSMFGLGLVLGDCVDADRACFAAKGSGMKILLGGAVAAVAIAVAAEARWRWAGTIALLAAPFVIFGLMMAWPPA